MFLVFPLLCTSFGLINSFQILDMHLHKSSKSIIFFWRWCTIFVLFLWFFWAIIHLVWLSFFSSFSSSSSPSSLFWILIWCACNFVCSCTGMNDDLNGLNSLADVFGNVGGCCGTCTIDFGTLNGDVSLDCLAVWMQCLWGWIFAISLLSAPIAETIAILFISANYWIPQLKLFTYIIHYYFLNYKVLFKITFLQSLKLFVRTCHKVPDYSLNELSFRQITFAVLSHLFWHRCM